MSVILNVLELSLLQWLITKIGARLYSIILDKPTGIGTDKFMAYCMRYFNDKLEKVIVDILGMLIVTTGTAMALHAASSIFGQCGFATAGWYKCSLWPLLFIVYSSEGRCTPFAAFEMCLPSLHTEEAFQELPSSIEFLLHETQNWFSCSPSRVAAYDTLYNSIYGKEPLKLKQMSVTHWLVFKEAVLMNLNQWESLKIHFNDMASRRKDGDNYTTKMLENIIIYSTYFSSALFSNSSLI